MSPTCPQLLLAATIDLAAYLLAYEHRAAASKAVQYCRKLGVERKIGVAIDEGLSKLRPPLQGATSRDGEFCVLSFESRYRLNDDETIAHEACHCALDYDRLTAGGWAADVTASEVRDREMIVRKCTDTVRRR